MDPSGERQGCAEKGLVPEVGQTDLTRRTRVMLVSLSEQEKWTVVRPPHIRWVKDQTVQLRTKVMMCRYS